MIRLLVLLICNVVRFIFNKLRYGDRYISSSFERFSNKSSIRLFERARIELGRNIELSDGVDVQVHGNGELKIGVGSYMNRYCMISCHGKVSIGENCMFGPGVKIFDNNHQFSRQNGVSSKLKIGEISVGNNCWIASDVIILKGAKIGNNCVVSAGCVIDYEIPEGTLVKQQQNLVHTTIK